MKCDCEKVVVYKDGEWERVGFYGFLRDVSWDNARSTHVLLVERVGSGRLYSIDAERVQIEQRSDEVLDACGASTFWS